VESVLHRWRESQPTPALLPDGTRALVRAPLVGSWWAFYVARIPLVALAKKLAHDQELAPYVGRAFDFCNLVAAISCMLVVYKIDQRQREQHRDLLLRVPTPPATDQLR
jgi:hypothetical protein